MKKPRAFIYLNTILTLLGSFSFPVVATDLAITSFQDTDNLRLLLDTHKQELTITILEENLDDCSAHRLVSTQLSICEAQGIPAAEFHMGQVYELGREGINASHLKAFQWYQKAAFSGVAEAQYALGWMYAQVKGVALNEKESTYWYRQAGNQGHPSAQFMYAQAYRQGIGRNVNIFKALKWYKKAAKQGHVEAQLELALIYRQLKLEAGGIPSSGASPQVIFPEEKPYKHTKMLKWCTTAALNGNCSAQYILGDVYEQGEEIDINGSEAVKWYTKAAEQKAPSAAYKLGKIHEHGMTGIPSDIYKAIYWYKKAAEEDYYGAAEALALLYLEGREVKQDLAKASRWAFKAAEQPESRALYKIGQAFEEGLFGISKDVGKAAEWYLKAAESGNQGGYYRLGIISEEKGEYIKAFSWYMAAQKTGTLSVNNILVDSDAQNTHYRLGFMYGEGRGTIKDLSQSIQWYLKAARQGHAQAQYHAGEMYRMGIGIDKDPTQAFHWYKKAAKQDHVQAQYWLGYAYGSGAGVTKDYTQAFHWFKRASHHGYVYAQIEMANAYLNGWGTRKDGKQAHKWYLKASAKGDADALYALGIFYMDNYIRESNLPIKAIEYFFRSRNGNSQKQLNQYFILRHVHDYQEFKFDFQIDVCLEDLISRHQIQEGINKENNFFKESASSIPILGKKYRKLVDLEVEMLGIYLNIQKAQPGFLIDCFKSPDERAKIDDATTKRRRDRLICHLQSDSEKTREQSFVCLNIYGGFHYLSFFETNSSLACKLLKHMKKDDNSLFVKVPKKLTKILSFYKVILNETMVKAMKLQKKLINVDNGKLIVDESKQSSLKNKLAQINGQLEYNDKKINEFKNDIHLFKEIWRSLNSYIRNAGKRNKEFLEAYPFFTKTK